MMSELLASITNPSPTTIVLGLSVLACIVSLLVLLRSHQKTQALNQKLLRLEHDLRVANGSAIGMGQQIMMLEKQLGGQRRAASVVAKQPPQTTVSAPPVAGDNQVQVNADTSTGIGEQSAYDQARHYLAQGLELSDVAKQCGLSFAEVSLLKSLSAKAIPSH